MVYIAKKDAFSEIWIPNILLSSKQQVRRMDIGKNLFILKITAHNDFIFESNFGLIK